MKNWSIILFFAATLGYFISFVFYLLHTVLGSKQNSTPGPVLGIVASSASISSVGVNWGFWGTLFGWVAVLLATAGVVLRAYELGDASNWVRRVFLPATTTYETFTFMSWIIGLVYLIFERRYQIRQIGLFVIGAAFVMLAAAASPVFAPSEIRPIVPSLDSIWLVIHVLFMLTGIACFTTGFGGTIFFLKQYHQKQEIFNQAKTEEFMYRSIAIGFVFYFIGGFVFGPIWAEEAWSRYWGWDPKEVGMMVAALTYAVYLHARLALGWRNLAVAWLAIAGYVFVMFAWLGVNYFLGGLHSFK
jgi:cytochrome c-type biogenesis protein CcsB